MLLHFPFLLAFIRFSNCQLLMVGGTEDLGKLIEVYHDDDSNSPSEIPDFPFGNDVKNGAVGGTYFDSLHLICGGFNAGSDLVSQCYVGKNNSQWSAAASMLVPKSGAAAAPFVLNQTQFLWVIGGHSSEASMSESTEIYSFQTDEWMKGVDLPEPLIGHTVTSLEDSKVLIAGGMNPQYVGQKSWIFDFVSQIFEEQPNMKVQRIEHVCASLTTEENVTTGKTVFCCAGYSDPNFVEFGDLRLRQMEIFDLDAKDWKLTNHFLPFLDDYILYGASMVALEETLILAGGYSPRNGVVDLVFEYHPFYGFRVLPQRLQGPRFHHVVIPLRVRDFNSYELAVEPVNLPDILVLGGRNEVENGLEKSFIFNQNQTTNLPALPEGIQGSAMVLHNGIPTVCGGQKSTGEITSNCFQLRDKMWKEFPSLQKPRIGAKMMSYETKLLITGGGNDLSTEVFNGESWMDGPQMLRSLSYHCIVPFIEDDEGKFLLIGGEQLESESGRSQHVYQGQIGSDTWIELPSLIVPRKGHTCGKYKLDNGTQVVVVAGGKTGTKMASNVRLIEVFNLETQQWSLTEQSVPGHPELGLYGAQIVETPEDLYLLGGKDGYTSDTYNTIYAYNQVFGFYDTGYTMPYSAYDFSAVPLNNHDDEEKR